MSIQAYRLFRAGRTIGLFSALALSLSGCLAFSSASINGIPSANVAQEPPAPQASPVVAVYPDHAGPAPQIAQATEAPQPGAESESQKEAEQALDADLEEDGPGMPVGDDEDEVLDPNYVPTN